MAQSLGHPRVFRTYRAFVPPGSSPGGTRSICDSGRRRSRHSLGPVWPGNKGTGVCAGGAPKAGRSPLEQLANGQRFWQEGGRESRGRRKEDLEGREGKAGTRDGTAGPLPHLSITPQIKCPRCAPGSRMYQPTKKPLLHFSDKRCGALLAPLGPSPWNSAQLLQLLPWAAAWTRPSKIRMALSQFHFQGETKTTGWKLWTSERAEKAASRPSWTPSGRLPPLNSKQAPNH